MKLGILTAPFPETPLLEVADWAASVGFEALEIACWPRTSGPTRRYAGTSHIDVAEPRRGAGEGDRRRAEPSGGSPSRRWATTPTRWRPDASTARP